MKKSIDAVFRITEQVLQAIADLVENDSGDLSSIVSLVKMAEVGYLEMTRRSYKPPANSFTSQVLRAGGAHEWLELEAKKRAEKDSQIQ